MVQANKNLVLLAASLIPIVGARAIGRDATSLSARTDEFWNPKAIYFMNNEPSNSIVTIRVGQNGLLSNPKLVSTGGVGQVTVNATGFPNGPDGLGSQDALTVAGDYLFAANPGSSTISMFKIDPRDPTCLTPCGPPMSTNGDFPVSVAASKELSMVCSANGGSRSGISCAKYSARGMEAFGALTSIPFNQTTPPVGPLNGISDIMFSEGSKELLVFVKGAMPGSSGHISVYSMKTPNPIPVNSSPSTSNLYFGATQVPETNRFVATDAGFGYVLLDLQNNGSMTNIATTNITDQMASCWVAYSPASHTAFVTDPHVDHLVEADVRDGSIVRDFFPENGNSGMIDLAALGDKLYALAPTEGKVAVFDVSGGRGSAKAVQNFDVSSLGVGKSAQGMVVYG